MSATIGRATLGRGAATRRRLPQIRLAAVERLGGGRQQRIQSLADPAAADQLLPATAPPHACATHHHLKRRRRRIL